MGEALKHLAVFDAMGNKVATLVNEHQKKGEYSAKLSKIGYESRVYIARIKTGLYSRTIKIIAK